MTTSLGRGHTGREAQPAFAPTEPFARGHSCLEPQASIAPGNAPVADQAPPEVQIRNVGDLLDARLYLAAQALSDIEHLRIATSHRQGACAREGVPVPAWQVELLGALKAAEHAAILDLQRTLRRHPLGPWVKRTVGVGEQQGARLLAAIGDPAWNALYERPRRGPAELWAFCGYAPEQKKRRGERAAWNHEAKMRAFLVAEKCAMHDGTPDKNGRRRGLSPYRAEYDRARASWSDRDTTDGHKHNHALRCVAKAILKDLYLEARACSTWTP